MNGRKRTKTDQSKKSSDGNASPKSNKVAELLIPVPIEFQGEFLHLSQRIQDEERKYGTIYLRFSIAGLQRKISSYLATMISLGAGLIVLSFILALQLQRIISKPLIELAEATKKVSDERDYSIRMQTDSSDEIGVLFSGFNRVGQVVHASDRLQRG